MGGVYKILFPFNNENKLEAVLLLNVTPFKIKNVSSLVAELLAPTIPIITVWEVKVESRV